MVFLVLSWLMIMPGVGAVEPTVLVGWDFDDSNATADEGLPVNAGSQMQRLGAGAISYVNDSGDGKAISSNTWVYDESTPKYWQITLSSQGYENLTLTFDHKSSGTGPHSFTVQYQVGGGDWTSFYEVELVDTNILSVVDITLPAGASNQGNLAIRWLSLDAEVGSNAGTNRLDNIIIRGTVIINDGDSDGVADETDNCSAVANADQADADSDGTGDACEDLTAPVITLLGSSPVTIYISETYLDAGATASDNVDGDLTADIVIDNAVNNQSAGEYLVTYNVTDANGNPALTVTRTVQVLARSSGGGAIMTPSPCVSVVYTDWELCVDGWQYRSFSSVTPTGCQVTSAQTEAGKRSCSQSIEQQSKPEPVNNLPTGVGLFKTISQVAGTKTFADGSLIRGTDFKIYVLINGRKHHILNLEELADKYFSQEIFNVPDSVIAQYETSLD